MESRNVTWLSDRFPVFWEEAAGANVRDADGNVFVDLTSAFGVSVAGHAHPRVVAAIREQSERLVHGMGDVHPPEVKVRLLERLAGLSPWTDARAVLASSGSEAVEIALKTALLATGRPGILAFHGGYHGLTLGALAATARSYFREPFQERLYGGVALAPWPDRRAHPGTAPTAEVLERVERILVEGVPSAGTASGDAAPPRGRTAERSGGRAGEPVPVGVVILEPVQGRGGVRIPPPGFLADLTALAHEHGALVVSDEIFTGMGRCGAPLASTRLGPPPDILCLGKALGGGMPLSACLAPAPIMDAWPPSPGEALHTSTFLGHPLACAASLAVLELLDEGLAEAVEETGRFLLQELEGALAGVPSVGEIRGLGGMIGVELVDDTGAPLEGAGARVAEALLGEGVLVLPAGDLGQVVELTPPSVLTPEQASLAVGALARAIEGEAA